MIRLDIVKYDEKYLEVKVKGETYTLFTPLINLLSRDPDVEHVSLDVDHPLTENVTFRVRARVDPLIVLERAVNRVIEELKSMESQLLGDVG